LEIPFSSYPFRHDAGHGDVGPSFIRAGQPLIFLAEMARVVQPPGNVRSTTQRRVSKENRRASSTVFLKATGLLKVTQQQALQAVPKLNSILRKGLGFQTPYVVFCQLAGVDAEKSSLMHLSLVFTKNHYQSVT